MNDLEIFAKAMKKISSEYQVIGFFGKLTYYPIIFQKSFAKAFWGENKYYHFDEGTIYKDENNAYKEYTLEEIRKENEEHLIEDADNHKGNYHWYVPAWQYHLQQMVLKEEPLNYLERFLT